MNYHKLQLSFILLLIMTIIQLLASVLVIRRGWLTATSLIATSLCVLGLLCTFYLENHKN